MSRPALWRGASSQTATLALTHKGPDVGRGARPARPPGLTHLVRLPDVPRRVPSSPMPEISVRNKISSMDRTVICENVIATAIKYGGRKGRKGRKDSLRSLR